MKNVLIVFLLVLLVSCKSMEVVVPEKGVSKELSEQRKALVNSVVYQLKFKVPESINQPVTGHASITFELKKGNYGWVMLDFKGDSLSQLSINGHEAGMQWVNEHLSLDPNFLLEGENKIEVDFISADYGLNRNDDFLYTLNVPDRASVVFPCFDQPDIKGVYEVDLQIPLEWESVSNGIKFEENKTNFKAIHYSSTEPISTYLFCFATGKFKKEVATIGEHQMVFYHRETTEQQQNIQTVFDLHRQSLDFMQAYTGMDYPFDNFEFVALPSFQFGGMEHPGSIYYNASQLFLPASASENQKMRRASLIAHETAHMWFGNLVTMKWFNDVWLKEVFANFMAAKIVNPLFPKMNHDLNFFLKHYPAAYGVDRTLGTHPIQQPLKNMREAGTLYGAIIYQKAPIAMRQLEFVIGEKQLQEGLQFYLKEYQFSNATWDDLIKILDKSTAIDLEVWSNNWIKKGGMPEWYYEETLKGVAVYLRLLGTGNVLPQESFWKWTNAASGGVHKVAVADSASVFIAPSAKGAFLLPNSEGKGYGYVHWKQKDMRFFLDHTASFEVIERAAGWVQVYENYIHGQLDPEVYIQFLKSSLVNETNPLIISYQIERLKVVFWNHIEDRKNASLSIESILLNKMLMAQDNGLKRVYYNGLRGLACSEQGIKFLKALWSDQFAQSGFVLNERDYIDLALDLALHQAEGYDSILQVQHQRIKNPDRKRRFEFVRKALVFEAAERDAFFESLSQLETRRNESWVLGAMHYFNHPLVADRNLSYLVKGMELTKEIQLTGDIFFPKRWLTALLGTQTSAESNAIIEQFLKQNPEYPASIKLKLLQSADLCFRSENIRRNRD